MNQYFVVGDRVKLVSIHTKMNPLVIDLYGEEGTIEAVSDNGFDVRVVFSDGTRGTWWINRKRLDRVG